MERKEEKKVIIKKTYTIELIEYNNNTTELTRTNNGFNALELLGLCTQAQQEILKQISGEIKPNIINRNSILNKPKVVNKKITNKNK